MFDLLPLLLLSLAQVAAALVLAARWLPLPTQRLDRAVATVLFGAALAVVEVTLLSALGALTPFALAGVAFAVPLASVLILGTAARNRAREDVVHALSELRRAVKQPSLLVAFVVALFALAVVVLAAGCLEVWSWDSLGYHLPVVFDAIDAGRFRHIPSHIPYVNVYPRGGERLFAFARLLLPDDGWIDLAQLPGALGAVLVTAALARRAGVRPGLALACAGLWLAVPAVALQIPTNYVDVYFACWLLATAYFVTGPLDDRRAVLAGLALAMLLACKAVALVPAFVCGIVFAARALQRRRPRLAVLAAATSLLGTSAYVLNVLRYGNPVWPVAVQLGPLRFAGVDPGGPMYVQGLSAHIARLPGPVRFIVSLVSEPQFYIYDMRLGGFGPVVQVLVFALPLITLVLICRRLAHVSAAALFAPALIFFSTMLLPMAQWPRFSLCVPAALLVWGAAMIDRMNDRVRAGSVYALAALSLVGLWRALPGFTAGEGPALISLPTASFETRLRAASIDGAPMLWHQLKASLGPGDAIAYDHGFELPGLLWRRDGATRVTYLDWRSPPRDVAQWLSDQRVRAVVLGRDAVAASAVAALGPRLRLRAACPGDPCDVYDVLP